MSDLLIRGLQDETVARLDSEASALGLSRNEYLRRKLEGEAQPQLDVVFSAFDLKRASDAVSDLLDDEVMESAWR